MKWLWSALAAACLCAGCEKVPYTHREQLNVVPDDVMNDLGKQAYQDALQGQSIDTSSQDAATLQKVAGRIEKAANQPGYRWQEKLIESKEINAWCLPGGKIGVYTGILPVMKNEAGMAFVLGHETGHAIAHHGAERLEQQLALMGGLVGLQAYLKGSTNLSRQERDALMGAIGLGAEVGVALPFSRAQESEADVIGMMLMAKAGYPPSESVKIWDRFGDIAGKSQTPAYLSDHPTDAQREANLRDHMAEAKKRYERNRSTEDTTKTLWSASVSAE